MLLWSSQVEQKCVGCVGTPMKVLALESCSICLWQLSCGNRHLHIGTEIKSGTSFSELILTLRTSPSSRSSSCAGQSKCLFLSVAMKGAHGDCCRRQCLGSWVSALWDFCSPAPPGTLLDQGMLLFPVVALPFSSSGGRTSYMNEW